MINISIRKELKEMTEERIKEIVEENYRKIDILVSHEYTDGEIILLNKFNIYWYHEDEDENELIFESDGYGYEIWLDDFLHEKFSKSSIRDFKEFTKTVSIEELVINDRISEVLAEIVDIAVSLFTEKIYEIIADEILLEERNKDVLNCGTMFELFIEAGVYNNKVDALVDYLKIFDIDLEDGIAAEYENYFYDYCFLDGMEERFVRNNEDSNFIFDRYFKS